MPKHCPYLVIIDGANYAVQCGEEPERGSKYCKAHRLEEPGHSGDCQLARENVSSVGCICEAGAPKKDC